MLTFLRNTIFIGITDLAQMSLAVFMVAYLSVHASNGVTGGSMQTLGSDIAPEKARGKFYGIWQTIGTVGSPASTAMFAFLSGSLGFWAAFGFLALMSGATVFILGTQVHDRLRRK